MTPFPEAEDLKQKFSDSRKIEYAAQAIGQLPDDPPLWAVLACMVYANKKEVIRDTNDPDGADGYVLDEIIRYHFELETAFKAEKLEGDFKPPSFRQAFKVAILQVEGITEDHYTYKAREEAVRRRWKKMKDDANGNFHPDGVPFGDRWNRLNNEWCKKNGETVFSTNLSQQRFLARLIEE